MLTKETSFPVDWIIPSAVRPEQMMFFDIETTGLSANAAELYLIGIGVLSEASDSFLVRQFFADDSRSEKAVLTAFLDALASHPYVISYNGNSFDLKFIETRCRQYQLTMPDYQSIDLMVSAKWMKKRGFLSDCKLVTIEKALGIHREDRYSGGELISVYRNYRLKKKISVCRTDSRFPMFDGTKKYSDYNIADYFCNSINGCDFCEMERILLLHNLEDIKNLPYLLKLEQFCSFMKDDDSLFSKDQCNSLITEISRTEDGVSARIQLPFPNAWKEQKQPAMFPESVFVSLKLQNGAIKLQIPFLKDELKLFYADYKNYYYLPYEDTAIHKSLGEFIDKSRKEKARKSTCYTRHTGVYLPLIKAPKQGDFHVFKKDYDDTVCYYSYEEVQSELKTYLQHLVSQMLSV